MMSFRQKMNRFLPNIRICYQMTWYCFLLTLRMNFCMKNFFQSWMKNCYMRSPCYNPVLRMNFCMKISCCRQNFRWKYFRIRLVCGNCFVLNIRTLWKQRKYVLNCCCLCMTALHVFLRIMYQSCRIRQNFRFLILYDPDCCSRTACLSLAWLSILCRCGFLLSRACWKQMKMSCHCL